MPSSNVVIRSSGLIARAYETDQVVAADTAHASDGDGGIAQTLVLGGADDAEVAAEGFVVVEGGQDRSPTMTGLASSFSRAGHITRAESTVEGERAGGSPLAEKCRFFLHSQNHELTINFYPSVLKHISYSGMDSAS